MKMRLIDLFNMIANKEYDKLPTEIKYEGDIWVLDKNSMNYYEKNYEAEILLDNINCTDLDKEIIILNKEIEKLEVRIGYVDRQAKTHYYLCDNENNKFDMSIPVHMIAKKLNEIIDTINEIKKTIDK